MFLDDVFVNVDFDGLCFIYFDVRLGRYKEGYWVLWLKFDECGD